MSNNKLGQHSIQQANLFGGLESLQTRVIARRKDFEALFNGFTRMKAISYVVAPDVLLEFFNERGYKEVEIIVGENLTESYKKELEQKSIEITDRLADLVEQGVLHIYVPARTIHTKLYILEREDIFRVIQTSANLTVTAQDAKHQINYAWYLDIPESHPILTKFQQDYESHLEGCSLFMDDLKDLLKSPNTDRRQLIEVWLKGVVSEEQDVEIRDFFHEISSGLLEASSSRDEKVTILKLPESESAKKRLERQLEPLKPASVGQNKIQVSNLAYVRYVYETHHVPMMILNRGRRELLLYLDTLKILNEEPSNPQMVNKSLEHIENYINSVDFGTSANPLATKSNMFEALLYIFFTPFANEYMKARRARFGALATKGPRFLYIYGPSQNGKTTFLHFALKLLVRQIMEPLSRQDFTRTKIINAAVTETVFPLVFDDVDPSRTAGMEDIFKSHWEKLWQEKHSVPQIIVASNTSRLKEWAKSRVKRIDFDVHFADNEIAREKLNELLSEDNPIFRWFSHIYLSQLNSAELSSDDELRLARIAMSKLYEYAKRPIPLFFSNEPTEKLHDPGRRDWRDAVYELSKANMRLEGNRTLVTFSKDIQPWEINDYQGYLPQTIKYKRKGNTIIIENPKEFNKWLGQPKARGLFPWVKSKFS